MSDLDAEIARALATTTEELEKAREVVRKLANELSDVVDIIEPALGEQVARIRRARMTSVDELRQIGTAVRETSELLLGARTEQMLTRAERFLKVMQELEEFRACGALEGFVSVFGIGLEEFK